MNGLLIVITSPSSPEPRYFASQEPDLLPTWGEAHPLPHLDLAYIKHGVTSFDLVSPQQGKES